MLERIEKQLKQLFCALRKHAAAIKLLQDASPGEGGPNVLLDTSAPSYTKEALASATGITQNSVYLTDGTAPRVYAFRRHGDTTSAASATIIIDGDDVRWQVGSIREWLNGLTENTAAWS